MPDALEEYFNTPNTLSRNLVKVREISLLTVCSVNQAVAHIDGWLVVVPKSEYRVGEKVVFCEIDSFLPADMEPFSDMEGKTTYNGRKGYRVRSLLCNGQISQGAVFPITKVPKILGLADGLTEYFGDWDAMAAFIDTLPLAHYLGVEKWERTPEAQEKRGAPCEFLGPRPAFVRETAAERVQNCPNLFIKPKYFHYTYQETIKLDGQSMSVYFVRSGSEYIRSCNPLPSNPSKEMAMSNGRFGVCSHRRELNDTGGNIFWEMARKYDLPTRLNNLNKNIAVQGELCGSTICGNREGFPEGVHDFFIFDIYDIDNRKYVDAALAFRCAEELRVPHVPILGYVRIREIASSHEELLQRAKDKNREGLVFKCLVDGRRFKVINDNWLLKHGE